MTFEEWYEDEDRRADWEWRLTSDHAHLNQTQLYWMREACRRAAMAAWHAGRAEGEQAGYRAGVRDEHQLLKTELASGYITGGDRG